MARDSIATAMPAPNSFFLFFPVIVCIGLCVFLSFRSARPKLSEPDWSHNPFDFSQPEKFFHMAGYGMLATGAGLLAAELWGSSAGLVCAFAAAALGSQQAAKTCVWASCNTRQEMSKGVLTFFCGKMGAGKTTKSLEVTKERNAVLLSEDEWLSSLYPNNIKTLEDYVKYAGRLRPQMKKLAQSILAAGTDVVMDFPANTISQRAWFKSIFSVIQAPHELIFIDQPNETCLQQIAKRRTEQPERAETDTQEMFELVTKYFVAPTSDEGFNTTVIATTA